jgi:hypothetical protein
LHFGWFLLLFDQVLTKVCIQTKIITIMYKILPILLLVVSVFASLATPTAIAQTQPTQDFCGKQQGKSRIAPDKIKRAGLDFGNICKAHDQCFDSILAVLEQTQNKTNYINDRKNCDIFFKTDFDNYCNSLVQTRRSFTGLNLSFRSKQATCKTFAKIYVRAVNTETKRVESMMFPKSIIRKI